MTGIRFSALTGKWAVVIDNDPFDPSPEFGDGEKFLAETVTLTQATQILLIALSQRLIEESRFSISALEQAEEVIRKGLARSMEEVD